MPKKKRNADKKSKKQRMKELNAKLKAESQERKEIVANANAIENIFTSLKAFQRCKRASTGLDVDLEYVKASDMDESTSEWMFNLLKSNMKEYYEDCKGMDWKDQFKRNELNHEEARHVIARDHVTQEPVGFVHLRYEVEDTDPVLYVYEIQLEESMRRKGLGKILMQLMELIAWSNGFTKIMLTVIKSNIVASNFYHDKLKYAADEDDPTLCDPAGEYGYEILSKRRKVSNNKTKSKATGTTGNNSTQATTPTSNSTRSRMENDQVENKQRLASPPVVSTR